MKRTSLPSKSLTKSKTPRKKKLSQKQILMVGIGGGALIGAGYLAYSHFRNQGALRQADLPSADSSSDSLPAQFNPGAASDFPLRRGSRGHLVALVQNALLARGGKPAMIIRETSFRGGQVDGIFGAGTQRALREAGLASALTQSQFTALVGTASKGESINASGVARELISAANQRNLFGVLSGLKKLKSVAHYRAVSTFFQGVRIGSVRVTSLVNALLSVAFARKEIEKIKIRAEFRRIGLTQNARGVWTIPNLGSTPTIGRVSPATDHSWELAITAHPTLLTSADGSLIVPRLAPDTVVGYITSVGQESSRILTQSGETVYAPNANIYTL